MNDIRLHIMKEFYGKSPKQVVDMGIIGITILIGVIFAWHILSIFAVVALVFALLYRTHINLGMLLSINVALYVLASILTFFENYVLQAEMIFVFLYIGIFVFSVVLGIRIARGDVSNIDIFWMRKIDVHSTVTLLVVFGTIMMGFYFGWQLTDIVLFVLFLLAFLVPFPMQIIAVLALGFLVFTPILLSMGRDVQAEEYAVYAYYCLVTAVMRMVIEVQTEKRQKQSK